MNDRSNVRRVFLQNEHLYEKYSISAVNSIAKMIISFWFMNHFIHFHQFHIGNLTKLDPIFHS